MATLQEGGEKCGRSGLQTNETKVTDLCSEDKYIILIKLITNL